MPAIVATAWPLRLTSLIVSDPGPLPSVEVAMVFESNQVALSAVTDPLDFPEEFRILICRCVVQPLPPAVSRWAPSGAQLTGQPDRPATFNGACGMTVVTGVGGATAIPPGVLPVSAPLGTGPAVAGVAAVAGETTGPRLCVATAFEGLRSAAGCGTGMSCGRNTPKATRTERDNANATGTSDRAWGRRLPNSPTRVGRVSFCGSAEGGRTVWRQLAERSRSVSR